MRKPYSESPNEGLFSNAPIGQSSADGVSSISYQHDISRCAKLHIEISLQPIIDISAPSQPNELVPISSSFDQTFRAWGEWDFQFICPEWCGMLSVQHRATQLSCRIQYIWLQWSVVKSRVLSFAAIIKPLGTRWVYDRPQSLSLGDMNRYIDNWLQIRWYSYEISLIVIVSQYNLILLMN